MYAIEDMYSQLCSKWQVDGVKQNCGSEQSERTGAVSCFRLRSGSFRLCLLHTSTVAISIPQYRLFSIHPRLSCLVSIHFAATFLSSPAYTPAPAFTLVFAGLRASGTVMMHDDPDSTIALRAELSAPAST